jgi:hypothetical protein
VKEDERPWSSMVMRNSLFFERTAHDIWASLFLRLEKSLHPESIDALSLRKSPHVYSCK